MESISLLRKAILPCIAVSRVVAKLVKSFGRLGDTAESLDDFRYTKPGFLAAQHASQRCLSGFQAHTLTHWVSTRSQPQWSIRERTISG